MLSKTRICSDGVRGLGRQAGMPAGRAAMAAFKGQRCASAAAWRSGFVSARARGVVLLRHAGRDAPSFTDYEAVVFCPGPDIPGALAAGRGTPGR